MLMVQGNLRISKNMYLAKSSILKIAKKQTIKGNIAIEPNKPLSRSLLHSFIVEFYVLLTIFNPLIALGVYSCV